MKAKLTQYGERSVLVEDFEGYPFDWMGPIQEAFPEAMIRAGLESLMITFPSYGDHLAQIEVVLPNLLSSSETHSTKLIEIPTVYDGEDLELVASTLGISVPEVISAHSEVLWVVKLIGFAPGFPYLVPVSGSTILDSIGRLETPRQKVPYGSVGLAVGMSCIYPQEMPGGWHLIGKTDIQLFDERKATPALLNLGDQVRFVEVSR